MAGDKTIDLNPRFRAVHHLADHEFDTHNAKHVVYKSGKSLMRRSSWARSANQKERQKYDNRVLPGMEKSAGYAGGAGLRQMHQVG